MRRFTPRELRVLAAFATLLVLLCAPIGGARAEASAGGDSGGYQRTLDLGASALEVQLNYGGGSPGASALAGEGSIRTALPGDGSLTLRLPHVVGSSAALGNAQLGASYDLLAERPLLPSLGLIANLDLPTAPEAHEIRPWMKATAAKHLGSGVLETIRIEGEIWADGPERIPGYRAAVGATLRLYASTRANLEFVSLRPQIAPGVARESFAQLGVSQQLGAGAALHAGVATRVAGDANSISASIGFDRHF